MEASGSPTAWSTLLSGSQMARRPRWTLSTSGPRVRAARGASSGRPASPGTWLLIREADDVERQQIMGHPHTAHRDGELTACQVLASLPDEGAERLDQYVRVPLEGARGAEHLDHRRVAEDQAQSGVRVDCWKQGLDDPLHGEAGMDEHR